MEETNAAENASSWSNLNFRRGREAGACYSARTVIEDQQLDRPHHFALLSLSHVWEKIYLLLVNESLYGQLHFG